MLYILIGFLLSFGIIIGKSNNKRLANRFYWFECIVLILLAGLRNNVGGDTIGYMAYWGSLPTFTELKNFNFLIFGRYQPLWYYLNATAKYIYDDFTTFQIIHAIILNISIFVFIIILIFIFRSE